MNNNKCNLAIGEAISIENGKIYSLQVSVKGVDHSIIIVKIMAPNGISCVAGHDILRLAEPDYNFYPEVISALKKCDKLLEPGPAK